MRTMNVRTRAFDRSRGYKLTESFRKCSIFLVAAIFILSTTLCFQQISLAAPTPSPGDYIVTEAYTEKLSMVTPGGVRTEIYSFGIGTYDEYLGARAVVAIVPGSAVGYSATIWGWDYIYGWQIPVPIVMDGVPTGYSTPYTFEGLTGTHTFTVPSANSGGHLFSDWSTDWTDETITVNAEGTYTARYRAGYSVTLWSWCASENQGWMSVPITMDGVPTGYSTPYTFEGLTGTHTFTVPSTDALGHQFYEWNTGGTDTTIWVDTAGVYTARYREPGKVNIRADGSIDPVTAPITTKNQITYVLTDNIDGSIVVERSNIVLDGAGYTVTGSGMQTFVNGTTLTGTSNVTVRNMTIKNCFMGIVLDSSSYNNTLSGNNFASNFCGIQLDSSSKNNTLSGNDVTANPYYGIVLFRDNSYNVLSGNNVANNGCGIWLNGSSFNLLSGNIVTANGDARVYGIALLYSSLNALSGNKVANNGVGIALAQHSYENFLSDNDVTNNVNGIQIGPSSDINTIYHNNFINNINNTDQSISQGSVNVWDDGYPLGGNYWSNHNPPDADKDKIGDLPYAIDENNTDKYPLIYPFEFYEPGYVCSPDLNEDGIVNIVDVVKVAKAFGCKPGDSNWSAIADMDLNEVINIVDVSKVAKKFQWKEQT